MSEQTTPAPTSRQRQCKPCLVCGIPFSDKPKRLKTRIVCGRACSTAYQQGENNPNWRGGPAELTCQTCGIAFKTFKANVGKSLYCSVKCRSAAQSVKFRGERSPFWKGGSESWHYSRRRAANGGKRLRKRPTCRVCGEPVRKGLCYHPECRPAPQRPKQLFACIDCGVSRMEYPPSGKPKLRCRSCSNKARRGPGNSNWKGGITSVNAQIRASDEYKAWRKAVYERDDYTCVGCGQRGGKLQADHIKSFAKYPELRFDVSNGRTLCIDCHKKTPTYLAKGKRKNPPPRQQALFSDIDGLI